VSEYGTFNKPPWAVASGPDGKLWFTENADPGAIGHMDLNGSNLVETQGSTGGLTNNAKPYDIAAGEDGALWFTLAAAGGNVARVATDGTITYPVTSGLSSNAAPHGIAWGPDGHVWFTESAIDKVGELDPATGVVQEYSTSGGSSPEEITVGPDGNLWYTAPGTNEVGRVTTDGHVTKWSAPTVSSQPWGIAAGSDGALWFTEANTDKVGRISTDGSSISDFSPAGLNGPHGIVAGGDGALWVLSSNTSGNLVRVAVDQTSTSISAGLTGSRQPWSGTTGPDGNVWFAEHASSGQLGRVTLAPALKPTVGGPVADTSAQLVLHVRPNGQATTLHVDYGLTGSAYSAQSGVIDVGDSGTPQEVKVTLTGLTPSTGYHARVVATNSAGTSSGAEFSFTTLAPLPAPVSNDLPGDPVPTVLRPVAPGPGLPAAPALGKSVGVTAVSGTVKVRDANGHALAFDGSATLPTGTVVDATKGTVQLRTALDSVGHTQTGRFWGGAFSVQQAKSSQGLTVLRLVGTLKCAATARGAFAAKARKPTHSLWGSDHHGRFQTRGKGAVATVRGTRWLTQDRCDGTLVKVTAGAVSVRDLHRRKTVTVRAGHQYLAKTR
jgi:virginiamycin B lyase